MSSVFATSIRDSKKLAVVALPASCVDPIEMIDEVIRAKRILVLGCSGSGKTHLTLQLAPLLDLEAIHLDAFFWKSGWQPTPRLEWEAKLAELVRRPAWIMDGCFERSLPIRLPAAELAIVLESNRWACLWRVVKRRWTVDDSHRPDAPPGQRIDWSGIQYIWRYHRLCRPFIQRCLLQYGPPNVVRLRGPAAALRLVEQVRVAVAARLRNEPVPLKPATAGWLGELARRPTQETLW